MHTTRLLTRLLAFALITCLTLVADLTAQASKPIAIPEDPQAALAAKTISKPVADGQALSIADGKTRKYLADVDILVLPNIRDKRMQEGSKALSEQVGKKHDRKTAMMILGILYGERYRTNAEGIAYLPKGPAVFAMVFHKGMTATWQPGSKTTIELQEPRYVHVVVHNSRGKPARNVVVGLDEQSTYISPLVTAKTDKNGLCRLEIEESLRSEKLVVQAMIASRDAVKNEFHVNELTDKPLQLTLPPCGHVRFILYGADERPVKMLKGALLHIERDPQQRGGLYGPSEWATPSQLDPDGAMFAHVSLGLKLTVHATVKGVGNTVKFASAGPTRENEMIIVEGRLKIGPPIISFRIVDQQGQPVVNQDIGTLMRSEQRYKYNTDKTDAEGRLGLSLENVPDSIYFIRRKAGDRTVYLGAARIQCEDLQPGKQDLGDVQLVDEPVIVRGQVLNESKQPVAGLWLRGAATIAATGIGGGTTRGQQWHFEHRVCTDKEGRFEIRELHPLDVPLKLWPEGSEWTTVERAVELLTDGSNQVIDVRRAGHIEGTFKGDMAGDTIEVRAYPVDGGATHRATVRNGKFELHGLASGTYNLKFEKRGGFKIENVTVPKPGQPQDPRLQDIDWLKHFQVITTKVTNEAGTPLEICTVTVLDESGRGVSGKTVWPKDGGIVRQIARTGKLQLRVESSGHLTRVVTGDIADRHIKLKSIAPIKVRIKGVPDLPVGLEVRLDVTDDRNSRISIGARLRKERATLRPKVLGKTYVVLSLAYDSHVALPPDAILQLDGILATDPISFEVTSTSKPGPEREFTLDKESIDKLNAIIDEAKELLKEHIKK